MLDTRRKTFGGAFSSLKDDLKDMNRDTRKRYLICALQDDTQSPDDIRKVEERIIEATTQLPTQGMFKHMTDRKHYINNFPRHWKTLEKLKCKWEIWRNAWNEHAEQRGDLIMDREWEEDQADLVKLLEPFNHSKPKGFENDLEWTEEYSVESCLIAGIQTLHTDTDSKDTNFKDGDSKEMDLKGMGINKTDTKDPTACDIAPPPYKAVESNSCKHTFGFNYRQLLQEVENLVKLTEHESVSVSNETLEDTRKIEVEILRKADSLQKDTLFTHMVCSRPQSHYDFRIEWQRLVDVCSHWSGGLRFERPDRTKLEHFISNVQNAEPKGFLKHPGWTEDSCAASCLTTIKAPYVSCLTETWANSSGVTPGRLRKYTHEEAVHITFGGAWRRLLGDMKAMRSEINESRMKKYGEKDGDYWLRIFDLEFRILQNVNMMPKHPLFEDMVVLGVFQGHNDKFMANWKDLETLSTRWKDSRSIWKRDMKELSTARTWAEDHDTLKYSYLGILNAWPKEAKDPPEWTQDNLPVAELMKKDWFLYAEPELSAGYKRYIR